ncbi:MAG: hypothetical protein HYV63_31295 [Candidatus Schekmanbacteria bacterium]|nr:hypothetical protein [Candidatus Schekmanbacteria bacterium]
MVDISALGGPAAAGVDIAKQASEQSVKDQFSKFDEMMLHRQGESPEVDQIQQAQPQQQNEAVAAPERIDQPVEEVQKTSEAQMQRISDTAKKDPIAQVLQDLSSGHRKLDRLVELASSNTQLSPTQMIAVQAGVNKITEELEMASKVVENAVSGFKQTMQQQI